MPYSITRLLEEKGPFLIGIDSTLMENSLKDLEEKFKYELFIIKITSNNGKIYRFKESGWKKTNIKKVAHLPYKLKTALKNNLDEIKNNMENNNIDNINLAIRDCFIEIFAQMLYNIRKYVFLLDKKVEFNKKLFLEWEGKNDKNFYDELSNTQMFTDFVQYFMSEEYKSKYKYFIKKIETYNKTFETFVKKYESNAQYIIKPDNLKTTENYINENNLRIVENIQKLDNEKFNLKNFQIYLIPEKAEKSKKKK